eukprot:CAMPEP_0198563418 /NCGR_PEP_ID=MMETSP1462-20131121/98696_1 /TAXON_ID=1333877 /ORGANISM="Brandtodinium nutriculum, Strain RCC3387" /LENGTH=60 /DNA_ID=CAMNT_0044294363 /DNA_START=33 /DNA_END=211 /DNA_ORIENTATION=-
MTPDFEDEDLLDAPWGEVIGGAGGPDDFFAFPDRRGDRGRGRGLVGPQDVTFSVCLDQVP